MEDRFARDGFATKLSLVADLVMLADPSQLHRYCKLCRIYTTPNTTTNVPTTSEAGAKYLVCKVASEMRARGRLKIIGTRGGPIRYEPVEKSVATPQTKPTQ